MSEPTTLSKQLLAALIASNILFAHWKSNIHLPEALAGETDLDILVHPEDASAFRTAVRSIGFLPITSQDWASYPNIEDWLGMDKETTKFLHLHVHFQIVTGIRRVKHLYLPWVDEVLVNSIKHESGWPIPLPEMELLILLIRISAKQSAIKQIFSLKPKIPQQLLTEIDWLCEKCETDNVVDLAKKIGLLVKAEDIEKINSAENDVLYISTMKVSKVLYKQVAVSFKLNLILSFFVSNYKLSIMLWKLMLFHLSFNAQTKKTFNRGITVALLGSDGSGKSTLSRDLVKWLRYKTDTRAVYLGSGDGRTGFIHGIRKMAGKVINLPRAKCKSPTSTALKGHKVSHLRKLIRLAEIGLIQRKVRLVKQSKNMTERGSVIIYDRFPQNQIIGISDGPKLQNGATYDWAARIENRLYNEVCSLTPDVVIKLLVSPSVAISRKPDHDLATLEHKSSIIRELKFNPALTFSVNADSNYEEILLEVKQIAWLQLSLANEKRS